MPLNNPTTDAFHPHDSESMATILLVEDQDEVRKMLRIALERAGYQVLEAPDGGVALEQYRENPAARGREP